MLQACPWLQGLELRLVCWSQLQPSSQPWCVVTAGESSPDVPPKPLEIPQGWMSWSQRPAPVMKPLPLRPPSTSPARECSSTAARKSLDWKINFDYCLNIIIKAQRLPSVILSCLWVYCFVMIKFRSCPRAILYIGNWECHVCHQCFQFCIIVFFINF